MLCWPIRINILMDALIDHANINRLSLENVAIENELQFRQPDAAKVPIRFNFVDVPSLKSLCLSVAVLERFTACYVTL